MAGGTLASARAVRLLFLTTLLPGARLTGTEAATQAFVDALRAAGHDVTVLAYRRAGSDPPRADGDVAVAERHIETRGAGLRPFAWMGRAVVTRAPYTHAKYMSRAFREAVAERIAAEQPAAVVVDHAALEWLVPAGGWPVPHVYLAHNVEHELYAELAAEGGALRWANAREARVIRRAEEALCASAAETWSLTEADATALSGLGASRVRAFALPPATEHATPGDPSFDVALLGSWTWRANAAGLAWFAAEVLPRLRGLDVHVAGAGSEALGKRRGLHGRGRVPDAQAFLQSGRVVAVPSVAGSGVQVKTLDAVASGRPVVATPVATRGIDGLPATVTVAGGPVEFAEALQTAVDGGASEAAAAVAGKWVAARRERFAADVAEAIEEVAR